MATAGMGVDCSPSELSVVPSTDAGNLIVTGSDGRLYSGDTPGPPPPTPAVKVFHSEDYPRTLFDGQELIMQADTVDYDTDGMYNAPSTLDINTAGIYMVTTNVAFQQNNNGFRVLGIRLNGGTNFRLLKINRGVNGETRLNGTLVRPFAAGDSIQVYAGQGSGGPLDAGLRDFTATLIAPSP